MQALFKCRDCDTALIKGEKPNTCPTCENNRKKNLTNVNGDEVELPDQFVKVELEKLE